MLFLLGGCAPGPHRRPARWRSRGRSHSLRSCCFSSGAAPPDPIVALLAGAREVDRIRCAHAVSPRGLRPRTPSSPCSLALARSTAFAALMLFLLGGCEIGRASCRERVEGWF